MPDDIERVLREALAARARAQVGDDAQPPAAWYTTQARRPRRWLAPLAAAAAVLAVVGSVLGLQSSGSAGHRNPAAGPSPAVSHSRLPTGTTPVHLKLLNAPGARYGVGMPVIVLLSKTITSGRALQRATTATVNGRPLAGAWYFERSTVAGFPLEAHWRPQSYWPAHARVHVDIPAEGLPAGNGLAFADSVTLDFSTGPRNISVVDSRKHLMTVSSDGRTWQFPVSLGATRTPTTRGTKVIMAKLPSVCMHDAAGSYYECGVKLDQRLTYSGEYLHSAPWNVYNIEHGINSSNGCTNLMPQDASLLYRVLEVGDVVEYPNADGPSMSMSAGYGDWNVPWQVWLRGGLVPTS